MARPRFEKEKLIVVPIRISPRLCTKILALGEKLYNTQQINSQSMSAIIRYMLNIYVENDNET